MFKEISDEQIKELESSAPQIGGYPPPEQFGPLRWVDKEYRCASRGCGSPSHSKLVGIPYCMKHALIELNLLCIKLGYE